MRPSTAYLVIGVLSWPLIRGVFRLRATGLEHLPAGGFVLAANHTSNFDPWPLGYPLFPHRQLRFMGKIELFDTPLVGSVLRAAGAFPVRRGERDLSAIETAVALARAGEVVAIYPEGTRRVKGIVKRHTARRHTGAARVALKAGVPLVPAAIAGTDRLSRFGSLRVAYGTPVDLDDLRDGDVRGAAQKATARLFEAIGSLERTL
ncbi:MAG: lysophospholipid acyltransferase family protein [Gaiellaceae bacterium]